MSMLANIISLIAAWSVHNLINRTLNHGELDAAVSSQQGPEVVRVQNHLGLVHATTCCCADCPSPDAGAPGHSMYLQHAQAPKVHGPCDRHIQHTVHQVVVGT